MAWKQYSRSSSCADGWKRASVFPYCFCFRPDNWRSRMSWEAKFISAICVSFFPLLSNYVLCFRSCYIYISASGVKTLIRLVENIDSFEYFVTAEMNCSVTFRILFLKKVTGSRSIFLSQEQFGLQNQTALVRTLALPLTSCLTVGKLLYLSGPQFPHL